MPIDFLGFERQFVDHLAPVWRALPDVRGRFLTDPSFLDHARSKGIDAEPMDAQRIRASSPPPKARAGVDGPQVFVASIGDTKIGRRLGYRRFAFIEHGIGQAYLGGNRAAVRHASYSGGMDREDTELFLVPNGYSANLWRRAYPTARVEVVGSPRLDDLPTRQKGPQAALSGWTTHGLTDSPSVHESAVDDTTPVVAISFHWPAFVAPEAHTAVGYFREALPELAKRFPVIGHCHPKADWPTRMARIYQRAGIEFVPDFDDVLRRADVYVCDNSSSMYEFASTGRPVVVLNPPTYRKSVHHGLRFWEAAGVGVNVDKPDDLIAAVKRALELRPDDIAERERALDIVYARRSGGVERAAVALREWTAVPVEAAA